MDTIIRPAVPKSKRGPYRRHSDEFKRAAVARTLLDGASVSRIARELEINSNQLFNWRKRFAAEAAGAAAFMLPFLSPALGIAAPALAAAIGYGKEKVGEWVEKKQATKTMLGMLAIARR